VTRTPEPRALSALPNIRLLIAYITAGTGHRRAAEALAQAAVAAWPGAEVECLDALELAPRWFRWLYPRTYLFLVRRTPWLWRVGYRLFDTAPGHRFVQPMRGRWNLSVTRAFRRRLAERPVDAVVVTHFLPADVSSALKRSGDLTAPLIVVVTDLYPHRFWLAPKADAFVVATPQSASVCLARGIAEGRVHVLGIPVGEAFASPADPVRLREALGLDPQRLTVLVTSGGTTVGQFEEAVRRLAALERTHPGRLQLLVICGEAEETRRRLAARSAESPMPMRVHGFVDTMADFMAASDLIVAKAGGLTISEALARGKPLVFYYVIPGQEEMNARYVAEHGAGLIARGPAGAAEAVAACLQHPERLEAMRRSARSLSRPRAAEEVMARVIKPLVESEARSP
jgi:processive 1,2-diacylglycerol beta-glucosyltransferase